jgi:hypothetical protein
LRTGLITALVLALVCVAAVVHAVEAQSPMENATAKAASETPSKEPAAGANGSEATTALPAQPGDVVLTDAPTRQRYLTAMQRYYEYRADGYAYRSRVFEWQLLSSRVIFLIVLVLVSAGIYFAAVQFQVAMVAARRHAALALPAAVADTMLATQIEVSAKGVVVNSSVLGVIILALSLAFFYLYLVYVYPIQNVM